MTKEKFCKDCVHFRARRLWGPSIDLCYHPKNLGPLDLVHGIREVCYLTPWRLRNPPINENKCGAEAAWFEKKV